MTQVVYRIVRWLCLLVGIGVCCVALHYARRVFIADQFVIPTESMCPILIPGDRVMVNKLLLGARLYEKFDFGTKPGKLHSRRMRGWRGVERNDLVVFNFPWHGGKIAFKINYVYAKRCIGVAGDSVSIVNGFFRNNRHAGELGCLDEQRKLSETPLEELAQGVAHAFPFHQKLFGWTVKDMGPLYIPRKGDVIELDEKNVLLYRQLIEYECEERVKRQKEKIFVGEKLCTHYEFKENYYFLCGDYVMNSRDSRYCGFVPEGYIVGIISHITYSLGRNGRVRWNRVGKCVLKDN